ncbi:MAG: hypothetical protein HC842_02385, partial [Cytophagales bacterium]|nr:hypothetical protein [Cytophagales bacterium]
MPIPTSRDFYERFIQFLVEQLNLDAAGIFFLGEEGFQSRAVFRLEPLLALLQNPIPDFIYSSKVKPLQNFSPQLDSWPFILWQFDPHSNNALLLCRANEDNRLKMPFTDEDHFLTTNILGVLEDIEKKKQIEVGERALKARIEAYNQELEEEVRLRTNE